jgi:hypothetical protein
MAGAGEFLPIAFSVQTHFHPRRPSQFPAEDDVEDEKDSEVFSFLGKKSQNGSRKYSLKVVARQRQ